MTMFNLEAKSKSEARRTVAQAGHGVVGHAHDVAGVVLLDGDDQERPDLADALDALQPGLLEHVPASGRLRKTSCQPPVFEPQRRIAQNDRVVTVVHRVDSKHRFQRLYPEAGP